jgi:hypothetical protein
MKTSLLLATSLTFIVISSQGAAAGQDTGLLSTRWYQDGPFAQFTPDHERVGCWSTAYAQILYYHRLKPGGRVSYSCASGAKIDVDLDQYQFDWNQFVDTVTAATPKQVTEQLARFSFAAAVVVRKDFGTESYKRVLSSVADLESHYALDAEIYVHLGANPPVSLADLAARTRSENVSNVVDQAQIVGLLTGELREKRPVYFHFGNLTGFGHSTVIDGFRKTGDGYQVHINYGAVEAERTRWYDLFAPIAHPGDEMLRAFVTIKPLRATTIGAGN